MGTLLKWLLSLILILIVLVVAAIVILPMVIDPNDYKDEIVATVKEDTGRDFEIQKDLTLTVFPWVGIETGGVSLGNAQGFEASKMLEIDTLSVRVKLLPLLSGNVEVDTLQLKGLNANLEVDKVGVTNWDDLAKSDEGEADEKAESKKEKRGGVPIASLKIQGIQIENANVSFDDRSKGEKHVLEGLRLETGALEPNAQVPVSLGMSLSSTKPQLMVSLSLNTDVKGNAKLNRFDVNNLLLSVSAVGEGLPKDGVKLKLEANAEADLHADSLQVSNIRLQGPEVAITGEASVQRMRHAPHVKAHLNIKETNIKTLAAVFAQQIETADPNVLTRVSSSFDIEMKDRTFKIDPLKVKLDDSNLEGYLRSPNLDVPVIRTMLTIDDIDVDRYLPPKQEGAAASSEGAEKGSSGGNPLGAILGLDLQADMRIGKLKANNMRMSNVSVTVKSKDGVLRVNPVAADLYEGSFKGDVTLDARNQKAPKLRAIKSLKNVQVGPLLKDLTGHDKLLGKGNVNMDLRMVGMDEQAVRKTLNGNLDFRFSDGAYKGVNIAEMLRSAESALKGGGASSSASDENQQTDFSELSASAKITNGVIKNNDLSAKSPLLRITGKGEVNLPADTVDYLVTTELVGSLKGQGGKSANDLSGIPIPVRVKGPLTNPGYTPDLSAALDAKAKQKLEEKKAEVKQKLENKLQDKLQGIGGGALKGLFGR